MWYALTPVLGRYPVVSPDTKELSAKLCCRFHRGSFDSSHLFYFHSELSPSFYLAKFDRFTSVFFSFSQTTLHTGRVKMKISGGIGFLTICVAICCPSVAASTGNVTTQHQQQGHRQPGPWSEILEDWVVSSDEQVGARQAKVMKFGDKGLTVSYKISGQQNKRDVSETDLYLLGAIEKLVYRVDFLEKRLRRAEELLYYVIAGNNNNVKDACPSNYTRVGKNCYHFSVREFDWKSSASFCRGMGGNLVELETVEENQDLVTYLQATKSIKGKTFWTGGLNPGLLWIWAASARPVHQDTKQTVHGDGRCLKLDYNPASRIYSYKGQDCGSRQRYICELSKDDESANKIERTARKLLHIERTD